MAGPSRHLRAAPDPDDQLPEVLVDPETGLTYNVRARVQALEDQVAGAERDLNGWRTRHANLLRDREAEARETDIWPAAVEVFDYWRKRTGHRGAEWTMDRFDLIRPHLERSNTGKGRAKKMTAELLARNVELCKLAIDGLVFDAYVSEAKNGRKIVHDGLHLVFGKNAKTGADYFEARQHRAPIDRIREVFPPKPEQTSLDA
jgi:hypothetical protein